MNRILVPYDFSEVATNALNFAAELAQKTSGSSVTVINVIEQPTPETFKTMGVSDPDPMENVFISKMIEMVEGKMETLMADSTYKNIDLKYKIVLGNPYKEIAQEIIASEMELVVMGTTGASGAEEFFVGSNAERLVRFSTCPVITLREFKEIDSIKKIVFASNFQEVPADFITRVKKLQAAFGAHLSLVKINTPISFTSTREDKELMEKFIAENGLKECSYTTYNYSNEEDGVVAFAEDVDADLIAIGTKQRRGLGHFLSGSIAESVVNHSKVPVWTFGLEHDSK